MTEQLKKILDYQSTDIQLAGLEKDFSENPTRKKYVINGKKCSKASEVLAEYETKSQNLLNKYNESLKKINEFSDEKNQIDKTCEDIEDEVVLNYLRGKTSELINKIDSLIAELESLGAEINNLILGYYSYRKDIKASKEIFDSVKPEYDELNEKFKKQREVLLKELKVKEKNIPEEVLQKYKMRKEGNVALPIIGKCCDEYCSFCRQELSGIQKEKLQKGNVIECENCHRILFFEK